MRDNHGGKFQLIFEFISNNTLQKFKLWIYFFLTLYTILEASTWSYFVLNIQYMYWSAKRTMNEGACGVISAAKDLELSQDDVKAAFKGVGVGCKKTGVVQVQHDAAFLFPPHEI